MTTRTRTWCFTINNYSEADLFQVQSMMSRGIPSVSYGIVGKEIGESATPHLQGYVRFTNALSFNSIKGKLPRAHIEQSKGDDSDNRRYCSKEGNFQEWGELSYNKQGERTDIKKIADMIRNHEITQEELMFDYPEEYLKYSRSFEKMFRAAEPHREEPPQVVWLYGLAGTGKTRYVIDKHGASNVYIKDGTSWWDGYTQHDVILIDDFDNQIPYRTLLRILDRYRYQGQVKGGYVNINSPFIYITCEFPPSRYWSENELRQVTRRLTQVTEVTSV